MLLSVSFVLSRILGLVRTAVIADVFGDSRQIEAYFTAFRIPDTMFMLVSGGALASAFVPVFAGLLQSDEEDEAWVVASTVFNTICLALAGMALVAFVFAPLIMAGLVGGSTTTQGLTVDLTRIMLLQPIFLGAAALIAGVLQSYERWMLTAIAPLVYNVVVVVGALLGHVYGVVGLAWSVVLAALAQVLIQLPGLRLEVASFYERAIDWSSSMSREVLRLFAPRVVGLAAFQAMLFITFFLAWRLPSGDLGAINYSWLLISFPVGALGSAAGTAILPSLSKFTTADDVEAIRSTVNRCLRLVLFLALPAATGLIVLRRPIINLLYHHGGVWTGRDTELTAFALIFYAMAVAQLSLIEVLPRVFYALRDTMTPVRIAVAAVAVDAVLSVLLVNWLPRSSGQGGLALATAVATTVQACWLARALDRRLGGIGWPSLVETLRDTAVASFSMAVILYVLLDPLTAVLAQRGVGALITVIVEVGIGVGVFGLVTYLLGAPELWQVRGFVRRG
jgi:putative peptidoglycan lipid II flippase